MRFALAKEQRTERPDREFALEYLVKWRGLSYKECCWEKRQDVSAENVADFEREDRDRQRTARLGAIEKSPRLVLESGSDLVSGLW